MAHLPGMQTYSNVTLKRGTTSSDTHTESHDYEWRYISVRRFAEAEEDTLHQPSDGTVEVASESLTAPIDAFVFEPNDEPLWNSAQDSHDRYANLETDHLLDAAVHRTTPYSAFNFQVVFSPDDIDPFLDPMDPVEI